MKIININKWLGVSLITCLSLTLMIPKKVAADTPVGISFQVFYDQLAPHGDWVNDPRYGYIWLPYVDRGFHPYGTDGYWVMTEYGNTWVSDYSWGWAPFHYGRWFFDNHYGWAWVPGYEWGPAWVNWRSGGDYYGWAPLGPNVSFSVSVSIPTAYWVFVPRRRFLHRNVYNYCAAPRNVVNIYNRTTIINNTVVHNNTRYIYGPSRRDVQRYHRGNVKVYRINDARTPGRTQTSRNSLNVYKPNLNTRQTDRGYTGRPSRVTTPEQARSSRSAATRGNNTYNTSRTPAPSRNSNSPRVSTPTNRSTYEPNNNRRSSTSRSSGEEVRKSTPSTQKSRSSNSSYRNSPQAEPSRSRSSQTARPATTGRSSSPAAAPSRSGSSSRGNASNVSRSSPSRSSSSNASSSRTSSSSSSRSGNTSSSSRSSSRSRGNN